MTEKQNEKPNEALALPALEISIEPAEVKSNAVAFRAACRDFLAGVNLKLSTAQEFGQAENDRKTLERAEAMVKAARAEALAEAGALSELLEILGGTGEELREARLKLSKQTKREKERLRGEAQAEALAKIDSSNRSRYAARLTEAAKGKMTTRTLGAALSEEVNKVNSEIHASRRIVEEFVEEHGSDLAMDCERLELESSDYVRVELRRRIEAKEAKEAADRLRAESAAIKAEAEAAKKAEAEKNKPPLPSGSQPGPPAPAPNSPTPSDEQAESLEWREFLATCVSAFGPVKAARQALKHPANIARAQLFADGMGKAWEGAKP